LHAVGWLKLPLLFIALATFFFCCAVSRHQLKTSRNQELTAFLQIGSSLLIARALTNFLWSKGFDPDIYALPVHSAVMDLIGQSLLVLCFEIVSALGAHVRSKPGS
jgi:solute carrier family 41